ncbi:hypothetical protein [Achromobacter piechaudii]|uniref:hypothetical protein n=1 Tax=Achromobacter piechaudii TaxID=72556 RepID=UPI001582CDCD|nr:hypothetical protein [Achromobacter piechaudii]
MGNSPPPSHTQWLAVQEETASACAALLNDLEKVRGKRSKFLSTDGRLIAWEKLGLSRQKLIEAYHLAVADRDAQGDSCPLRCTGRQARIGY